MAGARRGFVEIIWRKSLKNDEQSKMHHLKSPLCWISHTNDFESFESPLGHFAIWIHLILWHVGAPDYELTLSLSTSLVLPPHTGFLANSPFHERTKYWSAPIPRTNSGVFCDSLVWPPSRLWVPPFEAPSGIWICMEAQASRWPNKIPQALRQQFQQDNIGNREAKGYRQFHLLGAETERLLLGERHVNFSSWRSSKARDNAQKASTNRKNIARGSHTTLSDQ